MTISGGIFWESHECGWVWKWILQTAAAVGCARGTAAQKWGDSQWRVVRHGLLQDVQDLFKEPPEMGKECFNPLSQENRTPRLLSPSTLPLGMLGAVFGAPHRSGILQGSRWDERHFGGGISGM